MKILTIAWKDTLIRFRDRNALISMIAAPLILSAIIGSAFGSFITDGNAQFEAIPVLFIDDDAGEFGQQFLDILQSDQLDDLLDITEMDDLDEARAIVQEGTARAAVYIPTEFSASIQQDESVDEAIVQFYADPSATLTPNIVRGVVTQIVNGFNGAAVGTEVTVEQLTAQASVLGPAMLGLGDALNDEIANTFSADTLTSLSINPIPVGEEEASLGDVSPFAFFAPSMGILFLMFSMMDSTRSILEEEQGGTLNRLLMTPTSHFEILLGKIGGVFLTGILQFAVFVVASRFIFNLNWGNSIAGLTLMMLVMVLSLTSLGTFIAAFARDANQANIIGSVVTLIFAALGGNFVPAQSFPDGLQQLSKLTITRWGLDGFSDLTIFGLGFTDILPEAGVLFAIGLVFFALSVWQFERRISK